MGLQAEPKDLTFTQISIRGIIVLVATLAMIRLGDRRSLAKKSAFDAVLIVILASVLARAINGSAPFFPTIGASFVIVLVHRVVALASCHWHGLALLIKGRPQILVRDGNYQRKAMVRNHLSPDDVQEDMRLNAKIEDIEKVRIARLERSGDLSFILAQ